MAGDPPGLLARPASGPAARGRCVGEAHTSERKRARRARNRRKSQYIASFHPRPPRRVMSDVCRLAAGSLRRVKTVVRGCDTEGKGCG
ncbi:hypothetical protein Sliba_44940 [Streptomyces nigrescens]|uniref:Uncharacterized protein n=1 Tax=Streptomyces nigrescens TaxID=1920 RepID=A0A640TP38_STRNI|nr:hypothetical protein Sliba_44940 [Streptomyces libani subsp. libani]GGV99697.1 hypothetical protein GCM10010500_51050 [Streptomyces libani subsp. libani]